MTKSATVEVTACGPGTTRCRRCHEEKPVSDFQRDARLPGGRRLRCRACYNARRWLWRRESPTFRRSHWRLHLKKKYGITPEDYDALLSSQSGRCAACGQEPRPPTRFHLDHDHATGKIRGILCHHCNNALGFTGDSLERLRLLVAYMERNRDEDRTAAKTSV